MVLDFCKEAMEGYEEPKIEIAWVRQMIKALTFDKINQNNEMQSLDNWLIFQKTIIDKLKDKEE